MVLLKNLHPPTEGVRHEQAETTAVMDGQRLGCGTLYVAETRLSWFDGSGLGFSLEYPTIGLHAISRDVSAYPQEHLYVMVNGKLSGEEKIKPVDENEAEMAEKAADDEDEGGSSSDDGDDDDDDEGTITEIRFVPSDKASLESMFSAMCECQALHPDPEDNDSDNDFEGEEYDVEEAEHGHGDIPTFYTCDEGLSALTQEGQATLERLEGMLAQSVAQQYHMAGVRTEETKADFEDGMEVDAAAMEAGQFEDADVEH
ncbi:methylosome subunit pICln isoform X1 [Amphiprion ocellaris]|uniref:methylosome subunit pICln isoform X1 n=1 Tax=Amphiprion ocellaris TaxID=80972 RepID=UPI0024115AB5|nr:methylosome subunit pICln isoform X1 [Amphiprion ocellaris]